MNGTAKLFLSGNKSNKAGVAFLIIYDCNIKNK
jgi:hypothetical protein